MKTEIQRYKENEIYLKMKQDRSKTAQKLFQQIN